MIFIKKNYKISYILLILNLNMNLYIDNKLYIILKLLYFK